MNLLISQQDRWHHCGEFNALHKIESWRRFVAKSIASASLIFRATAQERDAHASPSAQRMPALLGARSTLECRPCSRPASRHSMIRANARRRPRISPRCVPSSDAAGSTASSCRAPTASRTNTCPQARSGSPGSPASPDRPARRSCWPNARRCSSTAATPCRRPRRPTRNFSRSNIWWMARPSNGWSRISRRRQARLRSVAAYHRGRRAVAQGLRHGRRRTGGGRRQSDRCAVERPPGSARWPRGAARHRTRRRERGDKLERIRSELKKLRADALVVSDPQNVAWTFNIRGADVAHTPLALAFAVVPAEGKPRSMSIRPSSTTKRAPLWTDRHAARARRPCRDSRSSRTRRSGSIRQRRRRDLPAVIANGGKPPRGADPIALMKAVKNQAEIAGTRAAHRRDGAAVANFLAWFDRNAPAGGSPRSMRWRRSKHSAATPAS